MAQAAMVRIEERRHHWSDWAGSLFFLSFAAALVARSPKMVLLMLPSLLHEGLIGIAFLLRRPLRRQATGILPKVVSYVSVFLLLVFLEVAHRFHPEWAARSDNRWLLGAGLFFWMAGTIAALWTVWTLRQSFSLVPQARSLVTWGPYALARHPIYASYLVQYTGLWLMHSTLPLALVLAVWFGLTLVRMRYEENVLAATFPEYAAYRAGVGAFGPRLLLPRRQPEQAFAIGDARESGFDLPVSS